MKMNEFRNGTDAKVFALGNNFIGHLDHVERVVKLVSPHVAVLEIHRADDTLYPITVFTEMQAGRSRISGYTVRTHGTSGESTKGLAVTAARNDGGVLTQTQLSKAQSIHLLNAER